MNNRLYILDTDILSLWLENPEQIDDYMQHIPPEQLATTIVTVYEQLHGWFSEFRRAKDSNFITRVSAIDQ